MRSNPTFKSHPRDSLGNVTRPGAFTPDAMNLNPDPPSS